MALEKQTVVDLIETLENGCVQVRTATRILDNGELISNSFHRHVIVPGQDYSNEDPRVQAICAAVQTPEIIDAYQTFRQGLTQSL
jgi:archaellum component FlaF (FlaF/FlaG flagellin family)